MPITCLATRRALILAALALAGVLVGRAAFADAEETPALSDPEGPAAIQDAEWRIAEIGGEPLAEGTEATITLGADGGFFGKACNTFRGSYEIDIRMISFGRAAATMMACAEPAMTQEHALFDALERTASWRLAQDGALALEDEGGAVLVLARR